MRRFLTAVAFVVAIGAPARAQVIWDSGPGPNATFRPQGGVFAGQGFIVTVNNLLTQFGFYGATNSGGVFKFFIADAANNVVLSDVKTIAPTPSTTLLLSDVFSFALLAGNTYSFGIIAQDPAADLAESAFFSPIALTQNGVTNTPGSNENWHDFNSPTRDGDGAATIAMQLRGLQVLGTPEPSSIALLATGLFAVAGVARRRRR